MVRLEDWMVENFTDAKSDFNSCMVRLEDYFSLTSVFDLVGFQFLYGTIGSKILQGGYDKIIVFQFLYGTIGSYN